MQVELITNEDYVFFILCVTGATPQPKKNFLEQMQLGTLSVSFNQNISRLSQKRQLRHKNWNFYICDGRFFLTTLAIST